MSFAADLLEQAEHLAKRERNRPKQASLRRAISTAYYSLFHLLIAETTANWRRPAERGTLSRMFEHAFMGKACAVKRDQLNVVLADKSLPPPERCVAEHLHRVVNTFVVMLQLRQSADYDNGKRWGRSGTLDKIASVRDAFESWDAIRNEPQAQNFLVTLLLKDRR